MVRQWKLSTREIKWDTRADQALVVGGKCNILREVKTIQGGDEVCGKGVIKIVDVNIKIPS